MTSVDSIRPYGSRLRLLSAILIGVGMAAGVWCAGCASQPRVTPLSRAMFTVRAELRPDYRQAIEVIEEQRHDDRARNEYVLLGMCETSAAMLGGNYETAERASYESFAAVQKYVDEEAAARAALSKESEKFFKGEPHERALLCYYAGLANYVFGKYNEARQYFTQSLYATKTKDDDMADFRDDFRLGYYWLGRAYLMRGETDNARISFRKAAATVPHKGQDREIKQMYSARAKEYKNELKGEAVCFEKSTKGKNPVEGIVDLSKEVTRGALPAALPLAPPQDPTLTRATTLAEFLSLSFQQDVNLIVIVELGQGPLKYARGQHATFDEIKRLPYREASADVYVDGHHSGPAFELLDTYHQAITRGVKTRRGRQTTKAVVKEIWSHVPYASWLSGLWNVQADIRFWPTLAGEYHVYAGKVTPGLHDLHVKFCDINGKYLPRYDVTRHFINVPANGETIVTLIAQENQDNAYVLTQAPSKK